MSEAELNVEERVALALFVDVLEMTVRDMRQSFAGVHAASERHDRQMARTRAASVRWRAALARRMELEPDYRPNIRIGCRASASGQ